MRRLSIKEVHCIGAAGLEIDIKVYSLGLTGIAVEAQGLVSLGVGLCLQSNPLVALGSVSSAVGATMIGSAAFAEYAGYSDLIGWYNFAQKLKFYKRLIWS